jgi:hypothetical protein
MNWCLDSISEAYLSTLKYQAFEGLQCHAESDPMKWTTLAAILTLPLVGGCIPSHAGEETSQGQLVMNRTDGVMLNQQHANLVTRWRGPMDHGAAVQADLISFRLWDARLTGSTPQLQSLPVDFIWRRGWLGTGHSPELQNPTFLRVGGKYVPNPCYRRTIASVDSDGATCLPLTNAPQLVQLGGRAEHISVSGHHVTFADGLDGTAKPCSLNLRQIAPDAPRPISSSTDATNSMSWLSERFGEETGPAYRFAVSYLPPQTAYIIDYGQAQQPIYHATCTGFRRVGQVLPLPDGVIKSKSPQNRTPISVLDIVADQGHDQPALLLAVPDGETGNRMVVVRAGRKPTAIPHFCHDCLPDIGGFFLGDPDWLLFDAGLNSVGKTMTLSLSLFDIKANREVSRTLRAPDPDNWPKR